MKKSTFILMGLLLTNGLCFAATPPKENKSMAAMAAQTVQGTIDSIRKGSSSEKSEISLKADNGSMVRFSLSSASIHDANGKAIGLDQLKSGDKAKVKYVDTKGGNHKARSVTLVK
ncbi:MAG: hypothetical protein JNN05_03010 [Candidatus Omnitrophica bacterium]|nr:hypothetical protein [Candidatus Omnitrophota bacterium]